MGKGDLGENGGSGLTCFIGEAKMRSERTMSKWCPLGIYIHQKGRVAPATRFPDLIWAVYGHKPCFGRRIGFHSLARVLIPFAAREA